MTALAPTVTVLPGLCRVTAGRMPFSRFAANIIVIGMDVIGMMSVGPIEHFIAAQPGSVERLLAVHRDDGRGRCAVCSPGDQTANVRWPCRLHAYARRAEALRATRSAGVEQACST